MKAEEAKRLALLSSPDDATQRAVTEAALREVGERTLTVRERDPDGKDDLPRGTPAPPWVVVDKDNDLAIAFSGLFVYGEQTHELALEEARRIASKWDWKVEE